jgi:fido (protein-threonine AMPylation protein)
MGPLSIVIPEDDPERTYTPEEEHRLTDNLRALLEGVHRGAFSHVPLGTRLLAALHQNIFDGVRSHAGRCRSRDSGSEYLTYGPHRSCHRADVTERLDKVFDAVAKQLARLEANREAEDYESVALYLAVWLHAEVIRIHPFEDGNGRTSRALMSTVLVRLGLRPISIDAPKQEYIDALNLFYKTENFDPLMDLTLGLYDTGEI